MKPRLLLLVAPLLLPFSACAQNQQDTSPEKPNILFIAIDDLRTELGCYGDPNPNLSPHIDAFAQQSTLFTHHFVTVPTCGASRASLLFGRQATNGSLRGNGAVATNEKSHHQDPENHPSSFPELLRNNGYYTAAIGKISHSPSGRLGDGWQDPKETELPKAWNHQPIIAGPWKTPQGLMHGGADGEVRTRGKTLAYSLGSNQSQFPDELITTEGLATLKKLSHQTEQPWLLAIGLLKPHLPFSTQKHNLQELANDPLTPELPTEKPSWSPNSFVGSGEYKNGYHTDLPFGPQDFLAARSHYRACVHASDAHVGEILETLANSPAADNTIVILWGDHGFLLGQHQIVGKHNLFDRSLHSPLLIRLPGQTKGQRSGRLTSTTDIYPTLCELTHTSLPENLHGTSLQAELLNPNPTPRGQALSSFNSGTSIRIPGWRLNKLKGGWELLQQDSPQDEQTNCVETHPEQFETLKAQLTKAWTALD